MKTAEPTRRLRLRCGREDAAPDPGRVRGRGDRAVARGSVRPPARWRRRSLAWPAPASVGASGGLGTGVGRVRVPRVVRVSEVVRVHVRLPAVPVDRRSVAEPTAPRRAAETGRGRRVRAFLRSYAVLFALAKLLLAAGLAGWPTFVIVMGLAVGLVVANYNLRRRYLSDDEG